MFCGVWLLILKYYDKPVREAGLNDVLDYICHGENITKSCLL